MIYVHEDKRTRLEGDPKGFKIQIEKFFIVF